MSYRNTKTEDVSPAYRASWWRRQTRITRGLLALLTHSVLVNGLGVGAYEASTSGYPAMQVSLAIWSGVVGILLLVHLACRIEGWDP